MTAEVITLASHRRPTPADVDKAWADFEAMSAELVADNSLVCNRTWFEEYTRRQRRFQNLFIALEGVQ